MLIVPLLVLAPLYLRLEPDHRLRRRLAIADRVPARRRDRDALAQRPARARRRRARPRCSPTAATSSRGRCSRRSPACSACSRLVFVTRLHFFEVVIRSRIADRRRLDVRPLPGLQLHPDDPALPPAVRARAKQLLGLLRARDRQDELGPALVLRLAARRDGARRDGAVRGLPLLGVPAASRRRARSAGALARGRRPARGAACGRSPGAGRRRSPGRWPRTSST